jgi:peroxiredoxin
MKKLLYILSALLLVSCSKSDKTYFSLVGKTKNIKDGTWFYLRDSYQDKILDSLKVKNNEFNFKTKIDSFPIEAIIYSRDYRNYNFLWLESTDVFFDSRNTSFKEAFVSGALNESNTKLWKSLKGKDRNERLQLEKKFIKENPSSIISASALSVYKTTFGRESINALYDNFSEENKNSVYGKSIAKYLKLNNGEVKVGDRFTDFEMEDINGDHRKLSDLKKEYILLEFWASNCGPCREENPNLVKTYHKYEEKGFEIFAVSEDVKKQSWLKAIEKDQLPWIHVSDLSKSNKAIMIYDVNGIPDNFLIDKNGIIIARNLRGEKLDDQLEKLFKNNL